jgi:hypothetical protein
VRTLSDITALLDELEQVVADELEDQDLDFKEWPRDGMKHGVDLVVQMAICRANGGGTVVLGVADRVVGRASAVLGVPPEVDVNRLKKAVYDSSYPKPMPVFEELRVSKGTGRLLVMQVHPGLPPYTDTYPRVPAQRRESGVIGLSVPQRLRKRQRAPTDAPVGRFIRTVGVERTVDYGFDGTSGPQSGDEKLSIIWP